MSLLTEQTIGCPYCGELIDILVDSEEHEYIEDCQVCCRPITFVIRTSFNGDVSVSAYDENEAY